MALQPSPIGFSGSDFNDAEPSLQHAYKMHANSCAAKCSALAACCQSEAWLLFKTAAYADQGSSS